MPRLPAIGRARQRVPGRDRSAIANIARPQVGAAASGGDNDGPPGAASVVFLGSLRCSSGQFVKPRPALPPNKFLQS
jgi:hypothetical protein